MQLTIQIPVMSAEFHGRGGTRIFYAAKFMPILTTVSVLRRHPGNDMTIEAEAFIPEQYRGQIDGLRSAWVTPEIRKCVCYVGDNPKTLREFMESGEQELILKD